MMHTRFGLVVEIASQPDLHGYVATTAVCTGRPYGRILASALHPAAVAEVERALADLAALACRPPPRHADSELARARAAAIREVARRASSR